MQSAFGNILVACHDGTLWRVVPEEFSAKKIRDDKNFIAAFEDKEFREDWFLEGLEIIKGIILVFMSYKVRGVCRNSECPHFAFL